MSTAVLSAITHVHGERRSLADLGEAAAELTVPEHGLMHYRASSRAIRELAVEAGRGALAVMPDEPDLVLFVSENETDTENALALLAAELGLESTEYLALRGHGCGNLGPALRAAGDALGSGRHDRVLLILADKAMGKPRIMDSGLSVCSDGAVACAVTRASERLPDGAIVLHGTSTMTLARPTSQPDTRIIASARLAAAAVADLTAATGRSRETFDHVLFGNYRKSSQRFLTTALRMPQEKLLVGPVADYGHCFSADLLVTLDLYGRSGRLKPGELVLGSAMGPYSWSVMALERA